MNLFLLEDRNYINNAVIISDIFENIQKFNNITNLEIKFKKVLRTQATLSISDIEEEGPVMGSFNIGNTTKYFSYKVTDGYLPSSLEDLSRLDFFNFCYEMSLKGKDIVDLYLKDNKIDTGGKIILSGIKYPSVESYMELYKNKIPYTIEIEKISDDRFKTIILTNKLICERFTKIGNFK